MLKLERVQLPSYCSMTHLKFAADLCALSLHEDNLFFFSNLPLNLISPVNC